MLAEALVVSGGVLLGIAIFVVVILLIRRR